jgi:HTH-type transcriptional regulator/antitoxin HigA
MTRVTGKTIPGFDREYRRLLQEFPPVKIRSKAQASATEKRIEAIGGRPNPSEAELAYLDLLSDLFADWEDKHEKIPDLNGVELVRMLLEERRLRQKDLVGVFATESIASEVLAGRRGLTRRQIESLAKFFSVSPAAFFPAAGETNLSRLSMSKRSQPSGRRIARSA